ncbi:hypothetical protein B0J13DRAFT_664797 [Dactylonectria estremocensis]|uniref:Rab-GAP TBC domain-containing protein n=1 Tax=Dactylonectria estremocensis TaxID=1079267 RepID=A0A9P9EXV3_9HYPO|nr:hypothetical protein B0J13DRAFT_664797 [Dactylonectria estremocensis]
MSVPEDSPTATRQNPPFYGNRLRENDDSPVPTASTSDTLPYASPLASPLASSRVHIVPFGYAYRHNCEPSDKSLSQLPPSPDLSNSSRFILQQPASSPAFPFEPPPYIPSPFAYDAARTPSNSRNHSPTSTLASKSSWANLRSFDSPSMPMENFSWPRKPSIRQPITNAAKPWAVPSALAYNYDLADLGVEVGSPQYHLGPSLHPRDPSVPSCHSSPTYHSVLSPPANDVYEPQPPRTRTTNDATCSAVRPPLSSTNDGSASPGTVLAPWMSGEELHSSFRSQLTKSTAPGTTFTAQSSALARESSSSSLYSSLDGDEEPETEADNEANPDINEPSLENVMGMYEKGFDDDGDDDESDHDNIMNARPVTSVSDIEPCRSFIKPTPPVIPAAPAEPEDPGSRDRYGFKKENQYVTRQQYETWNASYTKYLARRRKKWVAYLKDNALMTDHPNRFPPPSAKTERFVRKGIPPEWRGAAWFYYAGGPAILAKHSGLYDKLASKRAGNVDAEAIELDLHHTFPDNIKFKPPGGVQIASRSTWGSQSTLIDSMPSSSPAPPPNMDGEPPIITSLRRVLHAVAVYNPQIGYCRGLNFLAGLLLLFVETEEQCFWLLNVITLIYLPGTHAPNLEGSMIDFRVLMAELRIAMPKVWAKIKLEADPNSRLPTSNSTRLTRSPCKDLSRMSTDQLPPTTLCMAAWFRSCFIGTLPIESTLRVWDMFFYEGSKTLFCIALAIFKLGESEVKAVSDPVDIFGVVQVMPRRLIDANALMEGSLKRHNGFGHLSQGQINERRQEHRKAWLS